MTKFIQPVFSLVALLAAFVFLFVFQVPENADPNNLNSPENIVVTILVAAAGGFGITNWRNKYGEAKKFLQSKTKSGAITMVILIVAITVLPFVGVQIPDMILQMLQYIIIGGGGYSIAGMLDAGKTLK